MSEVGMALSDMKVPAARSAGSVMTREVVTVTASASIAVAIGVMLDRRVSGLPVVDGDGGLVGMLTEGDLLRRVELGTEQHRTKWLDFILGPGRLATDFVETHSRVVGDVMTTPAVSVDASAPLAEVVALMEKKRIKRVPVLEGGALAGVVSRSDLLRALAVAFSRPSGTPLGSDDAVRAAVLAELHRQPWAPRGGIRVVVANGVVDLDGSIFDEQARAAIRVVAENVPGVRLVRDHLTWVEPNSGLTYTPP